MNFFWQVNICVYINWQSDWQSTRVTYLVQHLVFSQQNIVSARAASFHTTAFKTVYAVKINLLTK